MIICTLLLALITSLHSQGQRASDEWPQAWNKTTVVEGLPFCALILSAPTEERDSRTTVYILMDSDQVTEENLRMLFEKISTRYSSAPSLYAWVYTDVEQLRSLAGYAVHSGPQQTERHNQMGYYRRDDKVELFRFNPNYPKNGLKTVLLRGKE